MIVPPRGRSCRFVLSAAGFIATRTSGASPGVRMSWSAKWSWKPDTPGSDPAGARISAGKSGNVERSFPFSAVSEVNRPPVSCIPSPESPANRITTESTCSTGFATSPVIAHAPRAVPRENGIRAASQTDDEPAVDVVAEHHTRPLVRVRVDGAAVVRQLSAAVGAADDAEAAGDPRDPRVDHHPFRDDERRPRLRARSRAADRSHLLAAPVVQRLTVRACENRAEAV